MRKSRFTEEQIVGISRSSLVGQAWEVWLSNAACQAGPRGLQGEREDGRVHLPRRAAVAASD